MNGLAVAISWDRDASAAPRVQCLLERMAHRGREGGAVFTSPWAALGATGAAEARRPGATAAHSGLWCVADARLDNCAELAGVLACPGPRPSEVELLLLGYERWGVELANHLAGDFAFVIWDKRQRTVYAARDPFGV